MKEPKHQHYFPLSEYQHRLFQIRRSLQEADLDALVLANQHNVEYTSGLLHGAWTHGFAEATQCVVIPAREEEEPVLIMQESLKGCSETAAFSDIRFVKSFNDLEGVKALAAVIKQHKADRGRIGAEINLYERMGFTQPFYTKINELLPQAAFVDATDLMYAIRSIKSPLEIEKIRTAVTITSQACQVALAEVKTGMSEKELGQIIAAEMVTCADACVRNPWFIFIHADGKSPIGWDGVPSDYRFRTGDCIYIDCGFSYQGYTADFVRIASIGEPSKEKSRIYYGARDANMALINYMRPGMKCSDLYAFFRSKLIDLGFSQEVQQQDKHRFIFAGHGIGLSIHEPPVINDVNEATIQEGMTLAIEGDLFSSLPLSRKTIALKNEENVLLTSKGCEQLTTLCNDIWISEK